MPIFSIVIPCYNSQDTLEETLKSVYNQDMNDWEAIIVNDGSPDNLETIALHWVEKDKRFRYYKKENEGLGSARNFGVQKAFGKYILPLDSDNKVRPGFARQAMDYLEQYPEVGVVYGNAMYFGEKEGTWLVEEFDLEKTLIKNYIDACAIYRKSIWALVGGYDTKMPYQGNEDWDLWLAFGIKKVGFKHLNDITFDYRVTKTSMINRFTAEMYKTNKAYIRKKYSEHYFFFFEKNYNELTRFKKNPLHASIVFLKKWIVSKFRFFK